MDDSQRLSYDLLSFIQKIDGDTKDSFTSCTACVEQGNFVEFVSGVVKSYGELLLKHDTKEDVEGCFNIICTLIVSTEGDKQSAILDQFLSFLSGQTDAAHIRLKIMGQLYNLCPECSLQRYAVFLSIVKFAQQSKLVAVIQGYFKSVDEWLKVWNLPEDKQRALLLAIAQALDSDDEVDESQAFLIKYLASFENASDAECAAQKAHAAKGAVGAIRAPITSFTRKSNLVEMKAFKQLEKDSKYGPLYQLLVIFSKETLSSYMGFYAKHSKFMGEMKLDHTECQTNMRLLSLCSLAAEVAEIPYKDVSAALQIEVSEVEQWVVQAITASLVKARMDQQRQVVIVNQCVQRVFGQEQWAQLDQKLSAWNQNIGNILDAIAAQTTHM